MVTKVKGTSGIEFPDSTVQSSAAYTKAEADVPAFSAYLGTTFTPPLNAWAKVPFNSVTFNYGNLFSVANTRMQPSVKGLYRIDARITNADATQKALAIYKNGSSFAILTNATNSATVSGTTTLELLPTDYIEIYAYMGSTLGVGLDTTFQAQLVRRVP